MLGVKEKAGGIKFRLGFSTVFDGPALVVAAVAAVLILLVV